MIYRERSQNKIEWASILDQELSMIVQLKEGTEKLTYIEIAKKINERFSCLARSASQCRRKYLKHKEIWGKNKDQGGWGEEEIMILGEQLLEIGEKWKKIAEKLQFRSPAAIKKKVQSYYKNFVIKLNHQNAEKSTKIQYTSFKKFLMITDPQYQVKMQPLETNKFNSIRRRSILCALQIDYSIQQQFDQIAEGIHQFNISFRHLNMRSFTYIKRSLVQGNLKSAQFQKSNKSDEQDIKLEEISNNLDLDLESLSEEAESVKIKVEAEDLDPRIVKQEERQVCDNFPFIPNYGLPFFYQSFGMPFVMDASFGDRQFSKNEMGGGISFIGPIFPQKVNQSLSLSTNFSGNNLSPTGAYPNIFNPSILQEMPESSQLLTKKVNTKKQKQD